MSETMHNVRTRLPESVFEALQDRAALAGVSLAEYARQALTADLRQVKQPGADTRTMTDAEKAQWQTWMRAAAGETDKVAWRARVDGALRKAGVAVPPLPTSTNDHDGLIAWAHAVHPHLRIADGPVVPPRWGESGR